MKLVLLKIKGEFKIDMEDEKIANFVSKAVQPDIGTSPSIRSKMKMECRDTSIFLKIESLDSTSFRASMNSSLRWIKLTLDIIETIKS